MEKEPASRLQLKEGYGNHCIPVKRRKRHYSVKVSWRTVLFLISIGALLSMAYLSALMNKKLSEGWLAAEEFPMEKEVSG